MKRLVHSRQNAGMSPKTCSRKICTCCGYCHQAATERHTSLLGLLHVFDQLIPTRAADKHALTRSQHLRRFIVTGQRQAGRNSALPDLDLPEARCMSAQ